MGADWGDNYNVVVYSLIRLLACLLARLPTHLLACSRSQLVHPRVRVPSVWVRFDLYSDDSEQDSMLEDGIEMFYTELGVDTQVG